MCDNLVRIYQSDTVEVQALRDPGPTAANDFANRGRRIGLYVERPGGEPVRIATALLDGTTYEFTREFGRTEGSSVRPHRRGPRERRRQVLRRGCAHL